tara:strand:+ start:1528 stop:2004 length:477 start_codon:yes stop_codon:yes gene_type:complete
MLEVEIQKLTAAITALTEELRSAKVANSLPTETPTNFDSRSKTVEDAEETPTETPTNLDKPKRGRPKKEELVTDQPLKSEEPPASSENVSFAEITQGDLQTVAMEITRADSSSRPLIKDILGRRGSKTITHLDPKFYREVHADLIAVAYQIAKNGEAV